MVLVVFTSSIEHKVSMLSDSLWPPMDAVLKLLILVLVKTLMDRSCDYPHHNTANIILSPSFPWRLYDRQTVNILSGKTLSVSHC